MSESWETTTQAGNVDLTLHPILRECYRVACLIERCGASEDLTKASSAAFDLCEKVQTVILELCGAGIADQTDAERYRWLRHETSRTWQKLAIETPERTEAFIDAAIVASRSAPQTGGCSNER